MPITNPVLAETKLTDPGSKPLGTGDPPGTVVVDGATVVVVEVVASRVLVVVVDPWVLEGDELHDAAQTARTSRAASAGRDRMGFSFMITVAGARETNGEGTTCLPGSQPPRGFRVLRTSAWRRE